MSETEEDSVEYTDLTASDIGGGSSELDALDHEDGNAIPDLAYLDEDEEVGDAAAVLNHKCGGPTPDPSDPGDDDDGTDDDDSSDSDNSDSDDDDDNDDDDDDGIEEPDWKVECLVSCKRPYRHLHDVYMNYKELFRNERQRVRELKARHRLRLRDLRQGHRVHIVNLTRDLARKRKKTQPTYPSIVATWIEGGPERVPPGINLELRAPNEDEEAAESSEDEDEEEDEDEQDDEELRNLQLGVRSEPVELQGVFPFDQLDADLQVKILRMVLVFDGQMVHAISRLDPHYEPETTPRNCDGKMSLLHRFHVGKGKDIEILWTGSQELSYQPNGRGKYRSRRTVPLTWLGEASRLKNLVVHVQESGPSYMRRKHEPRGIIRYVTDKTEEQPNLRPFRSLRTLQGLDYVHMLRGMEMVSFFDYDQWIEKRAKHPVQDFTFVMDVNNAVRRPKTAANLRLSRFSCLAPLIDNYRPPEADRIAMDKAINRRVAFGAPPSPPPDHHHVPYQPSTIVVDSSDSEDDDESSDSESDGPDDGSAPGPGSGGGSGGGGNDGGDDEDESEDDNDPDGGSGGVVAEMGINFDFTSSLSEDTVIDLTSDDEDSASELDVMIGSESPDTARYLSRTVDGGNSVETMVAEGHQIILDDDTTQNQNREVLQAGEEESLFVRSPPPAVIQEQFVTKVESPDPHHDSTPVRQMRCSSSIFVSRTPYNEIVRSSSARGSRENTRATTVGSEGARSEVIDLTEQTGEQTSEQTGGRIGGRKRRRDGFLNSVSRDGSAASDGSSPKRARSS
ncbi:hypothetical protein G7Z17_g13723 [Cylindrodendrum hubeiense]|uniref:Uncharacterized protein n=1 Tax=Cylindrodendrum hubeiense TaxID=595255 RepID=A0A9P5GZE7_9HYPO|nr:hypothetical protein G7Z17_g13723 [Cylindrodendrum hubeiense]